MISAACLSEENDENRSRKITTIVIGTMIRMRAIARCIFSNDPPQTIVYPSGSRTSRAIRFCASSTILPMSRPWVLKLTGRYRWS